MCSERIFASFCFFLRHLAPGKNIYTHATSPAPPAALLSSMSLPASVSASVSSAGGHAISTKKYVRRSSSCRHTCGCRGHSSPCLITNRYRHEKTFRMHPCCSRQCAVFSLHEDSLEKALLQGIVQRDEKKNLESNNSMTSSSVLSHEPINVVPLPYGSSVVDHEHSLSSNISIPLDQSREMDRIRDSDFRFSPFSGQCLLSPSRSASETTLARQSSSKQKLTFAISFDESVKDVPKSS